MEPRVAVVMGATTAPRRTSPLSSGHRGTLPVPPVDGPRGTFPQFLSASVGAQPHFCHSSLGPDKLLVSFCSLKCLGPFVRFVCLFV